MPFSFLPAISLGSVRNFGFRVGYWDSPCTTAGDCLPRRKNPLGEIARAVAAGAVLYRQDMQACHGERREGTRSGDGQRRTSVTAAKPASCSQTIPNGVPGLRCCLLRSAHRQRVRIISTFAASAQWGSGGRGRMWGTWRREKKLLDKAVVAASATEVNSRGGIVAPDLSQPETNSADYLSSNDYEPNAGFAPKRWLGPTASGVKHRDGGGNPLGSNCQKKRHASF